MYGKKQVRAAGRGFTLIELMIVVAIVAILAAIAYPSYREHVVKSRRATAQSCLLEMAQFEARDDVREQGVVDRLDEEIVDHPRLAPNRRGARVANREVHQLVREREHA